MPEKDYYKILGVSKDSSQDEIKKAFRQLARKYHPDINQTDKNAEEKFKEINEAFQVLGNPEKREQYDRFGTSAFGQEDLKGFRGQGFNFEDLFADLGFGDIFDIFNHRRSGRGYEDYGEGADLRYDIEITLEEAFHGVKKTIQIPMNELCKKCKGVGAEPKHLKECDKCEGKGKIKITRRQGFTQFTTISSCDKCHGFGKVASEYCNACKGRGKTEKISKINLKIPKGIDHGQYLKIKGKGEVGKNAPSGDLYVVVHIKEHSEFKRENENLFLDKKIDLTTAIFGGGIEIKNIDKNYLTEATAKTYSKERGDLFVKVIVDIPKINKNKEKDFKGLVE